MSFNGASPAGIALFEQAMKDPPCVVVAGLKSSPPCVFAGPKGSRILHAAFVAASEDGDQKQLELTATPVMVNVPPGSSNIELTMLPLIDCQEVGKHERFPVGPKGSLCGTERFIDRDRKVHSCV